MSYIKAADVLPDELVSEIQKYIDGQMLYIPRKCETHVYWGEKSGIREKLEKRDKKYSRNTFREKPYRIWQKSIICQRRVFRESFEKQIPPKTGKI